MPLRIAIAGCGPAGLAVALLLHAQGHAVTLYERFDAPQPVGSGLMLQPTGLAVLDVLGLASEMRALGAPIHRLYGTAAETGRITLDVRYAPLGPDQHGLAVHRAALFGVLHRAVMARQQRIDMGVTLAAVVEDDRAAWLLDTSGRRYGPFDLIIDATGARSALAQRHLAQRYRPLVYGALWASLPWPDGAGFAEDALQQRYRRASIMVGVLPIGRRAAGLPREAAFFWSIKPADYDQWRAAGLEPWKREVRDLWPETAPILDSIIAPEQLTLARYGHHTLAKFHFGRLVAIGDAAHATSPQLGQGANMALLDALALAEGIRTMPDLTAALAFYARVRRWHIRLYQAMSLAFTPFYQSDSRGLPFVRDLLFGPLSRMPGTNHALAALVAGQWGHPLATITTEVRQRTTAENATMTA